MRQCWPDGDLRAYVDGELPPELQKQIAGHLRLCAACGAEYRELSERASRVSNLMAMLPDSAPAGTPPRLPARIDHRRQWIVAGLSVAAAWAIGFVAVPRRGVVVPSAVTVEAPAPVATVPVEPPAPRPVVRHAAARRPAVRENFLRLDDEPIETGVVVRVSAENGDVQADLIVGPDGRAHAIRVVSNQ